MAASSFLSSCWIRCCYWYYCCCCYCCCAKRMESIFREFEENRDKIMSEIQSGKRIGNLRVFTEDQLRQATNNFHPSQVIGEGGYGKVYLGVLANEDTVAVKVMFKNPRQYQQFITELALLSSVRHKNLVKLIGCNLPLVSRGLVLVYEFVSNGTLADHLYGEKASDGALPWALRIRIAIETAEALAYLHSVPFDIPIVHSDVKSDNILLNNNFHVRVADFGLSRILPLKTDTRGTLGYLDPEYTGLKNPTDRTDVYSFGVVLLELISGQMAVDVNRESDVYLFKMAKKMITENKVDQLVESKLGYESDEDIQRMINTVAELAMRCLQPKGNTRPPMVEVVRVLKEILDEIIRLEKTEGIDMVTEETDVSDEESD